MNRAEYRRVADLRIGDAQALLRTRRYAGAYYLAGYAVECALKACIAQQFRHSNIPEQKDVQAIYVHDLDKLLGLARLGTDRDDEARRDPQFDLHWGTAHGWKETSRYVQRQTRAVAENMVRAVADPDHGVLRWLKRSW